MSRLLGLGGTSVLGSPDAVAHDLILKVPDSESPLVQDLHAVNRSNDSI
jgi:hypothetical protein